MEITDSGQIVQLKQESASTSDTVVLCLPFVGMPDEQLAIEQWVHFHWQLVVGNLAPVVDDD